MLTGLDPVQGRLLAASLERAASDAEWVRARARSIAAGLGATGGVPAALPVALGALAEYTGWCRSAAIDLRRRESLLHPAGVVPGWGLERVAGGTGVGPVPGRIWEAVETTSAIGGGVSAAVTYGNRVAGGRGISGGLRRIVDFVDGPKGTAATVFLEGHNLVAGSPYSGSRGQVDRYISSLVVAAAGVSLLAGPQVLGAYLAVNGAWDAGNWLYDRRAAIAAGARGAARAAVRGLATAGRALGGVGRQVAGNVVAGHRAVARTGHAAGRITTDAARTAAGTLRRVGASALDQLGDAASSSPRVLADAAGAASALLPHRWW